MVESEKEDYADLMAFAKAGHIKLESLSNMSYDELEILCNQLLRWKLFVANRSFVGEAIEQYMTSTLN